MRTMDKCSWKLTRDLDSSKNICEPGKQDPGSGLLWASLDITLAIKVGTSHFAPEVTHRQM